MFIHCQKCKNTDFALFENVRYISVIRASYHFEPTVHTSYWIFTTMHALVMHGARRTTYHDWAFKGCKVQPRFQFSPAWSALRKLVRITWNSAEASRQCCLCNLIFRSSARDTSDLYLYSYDKSVWLVFSWFESQLDPGFFPRGKCMTKAHLIVGMHLHQSKKLHMHAE